MAAPHNGGAVDGIFREFLTGGVPSSGIHQPNKSEIRDWMVWVEGGSFISLGFLTFTQLEDIPDETIMGNASGLDGPAAPLSKLAIQALLGGVGENDFPQLDATGKVPSALLPDTTILTYKSTGQAITSAGSLTLAHGLGVIPTEINIYLICTVAESGYSIGDVVVSHFAFQDNGSVKYKGLAVVPDATNIFIRFGSTSPVFPLLHKTTGGSAGNTNGNWEMYVEAKVF